MSIPHLCFRHSHQCQAETFSVENFIYLFFGFPGEILTWRCLLGLRKSWLRCTHHYLTLHAVICGMAIKIKIPSNAAIKFLAPVHRRLWLYRSTSPVFCTIHHFNGLEMSWKPGLLGCGCSVSGCVTTRGHVEDTFNLNVLKSARTGCTAVPGLSRTLRRQPAGTAGTFLCDSQASVLRECPWERNGALTDTGMRTIFLSCSDVKTKTNSSVRVLNQPSLNCRSNLYRRVWGEL